jgi:glycosyltransferase involved in cell wall biosynthesis
MRVAIVHDWMTLKGGGEACVEELMGLYPQADLFCVVDFMADQYRGFLRERRVTTSFVQRLPGARKRYRSYLPLMPLAVEQFDLSAYDLVISSSSAVAKGAITGPDQVHIAYVHSPIRYAWDLQHEYLREAGLTRGIKSAVARAILHYMRLWDARTAHGPDAMVANSAFVARRIAKVYGREARVIHPPVDIQRFTIGPAREDFYVTVSRLVPYKRVPLIAEAFRHLPDRRLVVIGHGPEMEALRAAAGPNVTILGEQSNEVVVDHLQRARAFLFAAEEDFGIAPVEAQACGTPVVAFGKGGALETVRGGDGEGQTGVFFAEQTPEAIAAAVRHLDDRLPFLDPVAIRANAERFSAARFRREIAALADAEFARLEIAPRPSRSRVPPSVVDRLL